MLYIVCLSYLSIPEVLSLTEGHDDFKIITDQPSLHEFCSKMFSDKEVILVDRPPKLSGLNKIILPLKLKQYKADLLKKLGKPEKSDIYIFYNAFGFHISWWLTKIAANNTIYYKPDIDMSMWKDRYTVNSLVKQFWIWLNFNALTIPVWNGTEYFPKVSDQYIRKYHIKVLERIPINFAYIKKLLNEKFHIGNQKYLLLSGNTVPDNMVYEQEYISKNDAIIEIMGLENVAIKIHPRFNSLYGKEKDGVIVPSFIPANIIFDNFDTIIGYSSAALFEAANKGKTTISLICMFEPVSTDNKANFIKYLNGNLKDGAKIFYPETPAEFAEIIGGA
ncbi:hypothetical protein [Mucilaginibacter ginsenosidivorax]|uniref:Glycosyltransferase family 4 protein n=1 Tax=Mucilaginibacter ginsenosidivorax TaxID=862126 RepID=A0A5B8W730_9SPHI|nr:hypothetical protein [Mucilaginibacter ginsenosidivorax]QEC78078.1 hypothetical protein FSB76_19855 [Mucilaginibacter ginsenosidivorax]